ncbi:MAG: DUF6526 family protein [Gemmatimonadota bacterium]|nr:DUF6526 family protein [Gemmatimonadota bacterium]
MPRQETQSYTAHRRYVPLYHFVLPILLLLNLGYAVSRLIKEFGFASIVYVLTALALLIIFWYLRTFATGVQDRVIRVEERLRFERLLPDALKPRISEFTVGQMVGLRFASDAELPELAKRVLDEHIKDKEAIKKLIIDWRADEHRI